MLPPEANGFRSHWQFAAEFCTPGEGHEKGGVEGEAGYFRRNHWVPLPQAADLDALNAQLLAGCRADEARVIQGRTQSVGEAVTIDSPNAARKRGIGIVYQELSLFPERSVLANLFVNREPVRGGLVSTRAMEAASRDMLDRLGLRVDVHAPVGRLSIGRQRARPRPPHLRSAAR